MRGERGAISPRLPRCAVANPQTCRGNRGRDDADLVVAQRPRVEQQAAVGDARHDGGSPSRSARARGSGSSGSETAGPCRSRSGRAPPPTRATASTTPPSVAARKALGAAGEVVGPGGEHGEHRDLPQGAGRVAVQRERGGQRGERQAADAQRAGERMAAARGDGLGRAHEDARLRAAEELVAAEADDGGAGRDRGAAPGLVGQLGRRGQGPGAERRR